MDFHYHTPSAIVSNDFNNDGKADVAVANGYSYEAHVLLGDGQGGLTPSQTIAYAANMSLDIVSDDFDLDGNADLGIADSQGDRFRIFSGDGQGTFGEEQEIYTEQGSRSLEVGRNDDDPFLDIVAVLPFLNAIEVFYGDGAGGFSSGGQLTFAEIRPSFCTLGDFNDDGAADLTVTAEWGDVYVKLLFGDGAGWFLEPVDLWVGHTQAEIRRGDLNQDGHEDLALVSKMLEALIVFLGDAAGNFEGPLSYLAYFRPWSLDIAEFNKDGKPDVAVAEYSNPPYGYIGDVKLFYGDGQGGFVDFN